MLGSGYIMREKVVFVRKFFKIKLKLVLVFVIEFYNLRSLFIFRRENEKNALVFILKFRFIKCIFFIYFMFNFEFYSLKIFIYV